MESKAVCLLLLLAVAFNSIQSASISYPILPPINSRALAPQLWNSLNADGQTNFGYAYYGQAASNIRNRDGHMVGSWSYLNPEGEEVRASYTADDQGFNVLFNNVAVAPAASPVAYAPVEEKSIAPKSDDETPSVADESRCTSNELRSLSRMDKLNATYKMTASEAATPNQYPFIVTLVSGSTENEDLESFCGGSLIAKNKVLTAAHCVTKKDSETLIANDFHVRLGMHTISPTESDAQETRTVTNIQIHEDYSGTTVENDIAVLTLDSPVEYTDSISPICLTPTCFNSDEVEATAMGWGHIKTGGPGSGYLRHAVLPVVSNSKCQEIYGEKDNIIDGMLCAHGGEVDTCQGDSGGPLVLEYSGSAECRFMQIGIVSYGQECGKTEYPGVYTRVSSYLEWLGAACGCQNAA